AAHLDPQMCFRQAPVLARGLNRRGGLDRLAKRLNRNARRRRDVIVATADFGDCALFVHGSSRLFHLIRCYWPKSLILTPVWPLYVVAVPCPCRYLSMTCVRRIV